MLPAGVIERIDSDDEQVFVNRTKDQIKNAPEFDERDELPRLRRYRDKLGVVVGQLTATGAGAPRLG